MVLVHRIASIGLGNGDGLKPSGNAPRGTPENNGFSATSGSLPGRIRDSTAAIESAAHVPASLAVSSADLDSPGFARRRREIAAD